MTFRAQRVRDPLHDLIEFEADKFHDVLWRVINTPPFQRLRRIKQLGFSEYVFPGATHTRFAHSLGVFHTARRLMKIVEAFLGPRDFDPEKAKIALAAALVHDVGHGPFSHAFENVGKELGWKLVRKHEIFSEKLIREGSLAEEMNKVWDGFSGAVADVIASEKPSSIYSAVVSSQFDADRLDYMRRDRLMTGTQHAGIDFEWLIANLEVGEVKFGVDEVATEPVKTFVLGAKAVHAAEAYVLGLFQLYPTVYFHKTTRGFEKLYSALLLRLHSMVQDGSTKETGLQKRHPLISLCRKPELPENILALDDACITGALAQLASATDIGLKSLASWIRDRNRPKCIDVREEIEQELGWEVAIRSSSVVSDTCKTVFKKCREYLADRSDQVPALLLDYGEREPYRELDPDKGPLNQIRIKVNRDKSAEHIDLKDRSPIVRAIPTYKFDRIYVTDGESEKFVRNAIRQEIDNAKKQ